MQEIEIDHTTKCNIPKPEFPIENETNEILWDFEIQTHHLITANKKGEGKKRNSRSADFAVPANYRGKINKFKSVTNV